MKLSTRGRYAVMAMADLAMSAEEGPVTLSAIAARQSISLSYLEQLFAKLRRAGIVRSVRGPGGGYALALTPAETRIADIMTAVEEPLKVTRCGAAKGCMADGRRCITHDLWDELGRHIHLFLNAITLEDVLEKRVAGVASAPEAGEALAAE